MAKLANHQSPLSLPNFHIPFRYFRYLPHGNDN